MRNTLLPKFEENSPYLQYELNRRATEINDLKIQIFNLSQKITAAEEKEQAEKISPSQKSYQLYPILKKEPTAAEMDIQRNNLIQCLATEKSALAHLEKDNLKGIVQFNLQNPSISVTGKNQKAANELALKINKKREEINLLTTIIEKHKNTFLKEQETKKAKAKEERDRLEQLRKDEDDSGSSSSSNVDFIPTAWEVPKHLVTFNLNLNKQLTELETTLSEKERTGFFGFAQSQEMIIADHTLSAYAPPDEDYLDRDYIPSAPPMKPHEDTSMLEIATWGSYGYHWLSHQISPGMHTFKQHFAFDEYKDPKNRYVRLVDLAFGALILGFALYAGSEYISYEDGTATAGQASTTLAACTYGLAALGLAYTLALLYGTVRDHQEAHKKELELTHGEEKTLSIDANAYHKKAATISFAASFILVCGFVATSVAQSKDIYVSVPGILLAPLAAILVAYATEHYKEAHMAAKTKDYQSETLKNRIKQNPIALALVLGGLAVIYYGAVGLNQHRQDQDALGDDIKLMVRLIGLLIAGAGLVSGAQKSLKARQAAEHRKNQFNEEVQNPESRGERYLYVDEQNNQKLISSTTSLNDKGPQAKILDQTLNKSGRFTDGLFLGAMGVAALVVYAYFSHQKDMTLSLRLASILCAFVSGGLFKKMGDNMEKHYNKIGKFTINYDYIDSKEKNGIVQKTPMIMRAM